MKVFKVKKIIVFIILFICSTSVKAQIELLETSQSFLVTAIRLYPVQDYTLNYQYLGIFGDRARLDVLWDARYEPYMPDELNVTCWLNCNYYTPQTISNCFGLQNCSYSGPQGSAGCTIFNPRYNYSSLNTLVCKFVNPNYQDFEFTLQDGSYPRRSFYPVKYSVSLVGGSYTVGSTVSLPIGFLSYSLLEGNYSAIVHIPQEYSNYVHVDNSYNTTNRLRYGEVGSAYPRITFLLHQDQIVFYINTTPNELPSFSSLSECPDKVTITGRNDAIVSLINNRCVYSFRVVSTSTYYSMPEYDTSFLVLLLLLSIFIFYFILRC